jgi:drug/metabolite transporter (DMT)-like permease
MPTSVAKSNPQAGRAASLASILFAFACVYLFWGSTYTAIRIGSQQLPAFLLSGVRFLVAGSILLLWCRFRGLRIRLPLASMASLGVIGFFLLAGGNVSLVYAEKSIPSGLASLLFAATPIYVALLEMLLPHGEPLSRRGWLGVILGFAGIITLLAPDLTSLAHDGIFTDTPRILGIVACLAGALSWTIGSLYSRRKRLPVNSFVAAAWQMVLAGVFNLFLGSALNQWPLAHWNHDSIGSLAWLITGGSLIGYSSYVYLLEHVPMAKVATYAYVNPIVAVLLGVLVLHERLNTPELIGMAAIVLAVALLTSAQIKAPTAKGQPIQPTPAEQTALDESPS